MNLSQQRRKIIFVCVGNSCRSQMAEGFAKYVVRKHNLPIDVLSAGTRPSGRVNPVAVEVMRERGIDISSHTSDRVTPERLRGYAAVITMGCSDKEVCPVNFGGITEDWALEDPVGQPIEIYREIRDQIEINVSDLLMRFSDSA